MMAYSNKFVLSIFVNGVPQQERADNSVLMGFDTEYSLRLRNKNKRRAVVKIFIDGENVSGEGYLIQANSYIDIERFVDVAKKFKFVDLESGDAVQYGKNGPNHDRKKGVIEAHFYLEKEKPAVTVPTVIEKHHHHYHDDYYLPRYPIRPRRAIPDIPQPIWYGANSSVSNHVDDSARSMCMIEEQSIDIKPQSMALRGSPLRSKSLIEVNRGEKATVDAAMLGLLAQSFTAFNQEEKDGATVEGSDSSQSFYEVSVDTEDVATVCTIILKGYNKAEPKVSVVDEEVKKLESEKASLEKKLELQRQIDELKRKLNELDSVS